MTPVRPRRLALALVLTAALCAGPVARADTEALTVVASVVDDIAARLDPRVASALARVDGPGRQLLALRSYLRSRAHLAERWSWSAEQIEAYENSPEHRALQSEIERVRAVFAESHPGYELWVNPQVRSLDVQIEHWNGNESVSEAAAALLTAAQERVTSAEFAALGPEDARRAIEALLTSWVPVPTPTVAAPGLSPHGQMRAVDFQVQQGTQIVAGPRSSTIAADWDAAGWTARLEEAVRTAGGRFIGPLAMPREPWHYTYAPDAVAARDPDQAPTTSTN